MTVYDGVMALIVLYTVVHGYFRGAAWQVAPIMSLVLGYMVAMPMSVTMAQYFGPPPLNRLFALVSIYILVSITVYLMVRSFREGIDKAKLTEVDRHLGAIMGGVKGILVTLVATCAFLIYFPQMREVILKSESSSIAAKIITQIYPLLPKAMHQILDPYLHQLPQDMYDTDTSDGYQGSPTNQPSPSLFPSTSPFPSSSPSPSPSSTPSSDPFSLTPTASSPEFAPPAQPVRRQMRSTPELLDPSEIQPQPQVQPQARRRPAVRSAQQEDDPFEAADPDRAISPPR